MVNNNQAKLVSLIGYYLLKKKKIIQAQLAKHPEQAFFKKLTVEYTDPHAYRKNEEFYYHTSHWLEVPYYR